MTWRVAKSLEVLRKQINDAYPGRDKSSDGTIGDEAHAARESDHNPDDDGVVKALDITHDPEHGLIAGDVAEALRKSRDQRIKYIISNRRISNPDVQDGAWREYTRENPHEKHFHISVKKQAPLYDDTSPWTAISGHEDIDVEPSSHRFEEITATVWGGPEDHMSTGKGAYGILDWTRPQVALPYNFKSHGEPLPKVRLFYGTRSVVADVSDVGPWNTNDPYWKTGSRPQAESGTDKFGRKTNLAGIDITVAAADALGLPGTGVQRKAKIDWEFVGAVLPVDPPPIKPDPPSPHPDPMPQPPVVVLPPSPVDWELIARLYSVNWKEVVSLMSDGIEKMEKARDEIQKKTTPRDIMEAMQRGDVPAAQVVEERQNQKGSVMNSDNLWQIVRYVLIGGGAFLAGKGYVTQEQVNTLVEQLPTIIPGLVSALGVIWGIYVKMGTKAVPQATANRVDVPTVSGATGKVEH